nr:hypothetical protein [Tanacetum cinerariifolium]
MVMMRAAPPSTYILAPQSGTPSSGTPPVLPIPLPTSSPPLLLPSTDCKADVPEVTPTGGFRADYGFVGTLDVEIRRDPDREIVSLRRSYARTARLIESEAKASCEAWVQSMDVSDTARSEELALLYERMFPEESDKIEKYVIGLPDMIHGSVMASKPKTMQDAVEFATELMDKKIHTFVECQIENKRKQDDNQQRQKRGRTLARPTLLGLVIKRSIVDLCQNVPCETTIIMVHVYQSATSATMLATWTVIAGVLAIPT